MYKNISLHIPSSCLCCRLWRQHMNTPGALQDAFTAWNMLSIRHFKITYVSKIYLIFTVCTCFYITVKAVSPAASSTTHCHCPVVLRCEYSRTIGVFFNETQHGFQCWKYFYIKLWIWFDVTAPEHISARVRRKFQWYHPEGTQLKETETILLEAPQSTWGLLQWATCY